MIKLYRNLLFIKNKLIRLLNKFDHLLKVEYFTDKNFDKLIKEIVKEIPSNFLDNKNSYIKIY